MKLIIEAATSASHNDVPRANSTALVLMPDTVPRITASRSSLLTPRLSPELRSSLWTVRSIRFFQLLLPLLSDLPRSRYIASRYQHLHHRSHMSAPRPRRFKTSDLLENFSLRSCQSHW